MNAWQTKIPPKAHVRWLLACGCLSILAMAGMIVAMPDIDQHPVAFSFSISWVIGGFVGLATQDRLLRMNPQMFRYARWEQEGRVYRYFGVGAFRWLLRHTPMGWLNPVLRLTECKKTGLETLLRQMNFAEGAHLIGGGITLSLAVWFLVDDHAAIGFCFIFITVFFHFYPLITQRWNRGRVSRIFQRVEGRSREPTASR